MVKKESGSLQPGEKVAVSIGASDVIGEVVEIYGPELGPKALVEIPIHGSTGLTIERRVTSYPLRSLKPLQDLNTDDLRAHLRRYRPVAASVEPGQEPPMWNWEPYLIVREELGRRGLSEIEIDELAWGWREGDD